MPNTSQRGKIIKALLRGQERNIGYTPADLTGTCLSIQLGQAYVSGKQPFVVAEKLVQGA